MVLVAIVLICATLAVAIPLSGFIFGIMAGQSKPAVVTVSSVNIAHDFSTCEIQVVNLSSTDTTVAGVALFYPAGPNANSAVAHGLNIESKPGTATTVNLTQSCFSSLGSGGAATAGEMFTGVVSLSNGGVAYFSGRFS
jgi:hypothetical protein